MRIFRKKEYGGERDYFRDGNGTTRLPTRASGREGGSVQGTRGRECSVRVTDRSGAGLWPASRPARAHAGPGLRRGLSHRGMWYVVAPDIPASHGGRGLSRHRDGDGIKYPEG